MKEYKLKEVRNVAVVGHLGSGKTSLVEALLFVTKAIEKKGEVEKKNTVSDYTVEEQSHLSTLTTSFIPVEYDNFKVNFIDTPGSEEFVGELANALHIADAALLVIDASKGVEVGTERCWDELRQRNIPTVFFINKMDKENVKFDQVMEQIKALTNRSVLFNVPIGSGDTFKGFAMVLENRSYLFQNGTVSENEVPEELASKVKEIAGQLSETVAETSEDLLDKFFSVGLTEKDIAKGLQTAIRRGDLYPVILGSAVKNIGIKSILKVINTYLPSFEDLKEVKALDEKGKEISVKISESEPFSALVFKTAYDPFVGAINSFKIISGKVSVGDTVYVSNEKKLIKVPQLFLLRGKTQIPVTTGYAGDIISVAKVPELVNSYTICDKNRIVEFPKITTYLPTIYVRIIPKDKKDEEKISPSLQKLSAEDNTFDLVWNKETGEQLIGGQGMTHIAYILEKMKNSFKVEVDTSIPKVVYRETIRTKAEAQGRHKKQSGGAGQFGDVWIRFEPTSEDFVFAEEIFGGSVPKNFHPAVEKGLREILEKGPLAGFPVIGVKATLYDGSYHPVDSNEASFVQAAKLAWKNAAMNLKPTILEPIMKVKVIVKSEYLGTIMGDMTKRRGRILGTEDLNGGRTVLTAEVPESEILTYTTELKAMTQASGHFTREFLRYQAVPEELIAKIVSEYKIEN